MDERKEQEEVEALREEVSILHFENCEIVRMIVSNVSIVRMISARNYFALLTSSFGIEKAPHLPLW